MGIVSAVLVVQRWLKGTTAALDAIPGIVRASGDAAHAAAEALGIARKAHERLDVVGERMAAAQSANVERFARLEERWASHDREQDRRDEELDARLGEIKETLGDLRKLINELLTRGA